MELEALEAIMGDDFKGLLDIYIYILELHLRGVVLMMGYLVSEVAPGESGLNTSNRCNQISLTPQVKIRLYLGSYLCFSSVSRVYLKQGSNRLYLSHRVKDLFVPLIR